MSCDFKALFKDNDSISLETYMAWNNAIYYENQDVFGTEGDFITAPELTPVFGYTLAQWVLHQMNRYLHATSVALIEFGPGRGVLMRDILKAIKAARCLEKIHPILVDISARRRQEQKETLAEFDQGLIQFVTSMPQINIKPNQPVIIVANEFFDTFPIRQWVHREGQTFERCIRKRKDKLEFCEEQSYKEYAMDGIYEYSVQGVRYFHHIINLLKQQRGSLLMIDYGEWDGKGDTLQAIKNHAQVSPLGAPGKVDLTAHVHFSGYAACVPTSWQTIFQTQSEFLRKLGIDALFTLFWLKEMNCCGFEARNFSKSTLIMKRERLQKIKKRLLGHEPNDMGQLFKAFEVKVL
jgi:SAM-dependent MidA family methyltransferase